MKRVPSALLAVAGALVFIGCQQSVEPRCGPNADAGCTDAGAASDAPAVVDAPADAPAWDGPAVPCMEATAGDPCAVTGPACSRVLQPCSGGGFPSLSCSCSAEHVWWCYELEPCGWHSDGGVDGDAPDVPAPPPDAAVTPSEPIPGAVDCNATPCEVAGHACCNPGGGSLPVCSARAASVGAGCAICDGPEDCASGESCCTGTITACARSMDCLAGAPYTAVVCRSDNDCPAGTQHCCPAPYDPSRPADSAWICTQNPCGS